MKITLYSISDCQFSKQEKDYLISHNLPFEEKNLEVNREYLTEMLAVSNNFAGTPVTRIEKDNGQVVVLKGFTLTDFDDTLGFAAPQLPPATAAPAPAPAPQAVAPVAPIVNPAPAPQAPPVAVEPPQPVAPPPATVQQYVPPAPVAPEPVEYQPPVQEYVPPAPVAPEPVAFVPQQPAPAPVQDYMPPAPQSPVQAPVAQAPNSDALNSILNDLQSKVGGYQQPPAGNNPTGNS
jgi:glutaredoxin